MQIGIDARIASYNNSGISRYFWGLLGGLAQAASDLRYTIYFSRRQRLSLQLDSRFRIRYLLTPPHNRLEEFLLPLEMNRSSCSLFHAMDFFIPTARSVPQVLSVYDLYFLRDPESLSPESYRHYRRVCRYAEHAQHIICSSEATRKDLLDQTSVRPQNVSVVYPGHTPTGASDSEPDVRTKYSLNQRFMLFVGTIEPRKNLTRLVQAFKRAKQLENGSMPQLVLVGRKGFQADRILHAIGEAGLPSSICYLGELPETDVRALYRAAELVVYPSLYEGFGFPLVEAMAAGTPVLSSNVSSIPEVAGDAAYLVEPESVESISDGLLALAKNPELRRELILRGNARSRSFSWQDAAAKTIEIYRRAAVQ